MTDASSNSQPLAPRAQASGASRREGHFRSYGGCELFYQTWSRPENNETLVVTHGMAEHSECYAGTAEVLVALGWNVVAWDLRGHGRSEGKRGFVQAFDDYSRDLDCLLKFLASGDRLKEDFALIGHSMGGLVTLRYLLDETVETSLTPRAVALSAPLLGISVAVPAVKDFAARLLSRAFPTLTLHNEIRYEDLTRDRERMKAYDNDPLRHDKISPGLYLGMLETMEYVKSRADRLRHPLLIQAAGREKIVSLPAIRDFFDRVGSADKKLIIYEESYHEIYNDLDREDVFKDLNTYLEARVRTTQKTR